MSLAVITSLRRNLTEWAQRAGNRNFLERDQEAQLRTSLPDPRRRPQVHVAAWMLGTWRLGHGFVRVLDGDGLGFDEARTGQALRRCSLLLRTRAQQPPRGRGQRKLPFSLAHGTVTALLGLALHDPGAEPLYDLLCALPDGEFGEGDQLALFTRELLMLRAGRRPTVTARLGPYEAVLAQWDGDQRLLARRLADVLELHLQAVRSSEAPFDDPPCQLFPLEAIAVRNVREWLEQRTPKIDHPLMFTNLGTMSPTTPWPGDPLVAQLEREAHTR